MNIKVYPVDLELDSLNFHHRMVISLYLCVTMSTLLWMNIAARLQSFRVVFVDFFWRNFVISADLETRLAIVSKNTSYVSQLTPGY